MFLRQKGFAHPFLILGLILAGIVVGILFIRNPQILRPQAATDSRQLFAFTINYSVIPRGGAMVINWNYSSSAQPHPNDMFEIFNNSDGSHVGSMYVTSCNGTPGAAAQPGAAGQCTFSTENYGEGGYSIYFFNGTDPANRVPGVEAIFTVADPSVQAVAATPPPSDHQRDALGDNKIWVDPGVIIPIDNVDSDLVSRLRSNRVQGQLGWALDIVQALEAQRSAKGAGVKVAVLDTGIDEDIELNGEKIFEDKVIARKDFTGSVDGAKDKYGHGTRVGNEVLEVAPEAKLINAKVLSDFGYGEMRWIKDGIIWAIENGATVVSMSLGAEWDCNDPRSKEIQALIDKYSDKVVFVAAAGNRGKSKNHTPANCKGVVPVSATNRNDLKWVNSNEEPGNIFAPGEEVILVGLNGLELGSGTSYATPIVSGVAALALSNRPDYTAKQLRELLKYGADTTSQDKERINALRVVQERLSAKACSPRPNVNLSTTRDSQGLRTILEAGRLRIKNVKIDKQSNATAKITDLDNQTKILEVNTRGGPFMVNFTVVDGCGDWKTFVGAGS